MYLKLIQLEPFHPLDYYSHVGSPRVFGTWSIFLDVSTHLVNLASLLSQPDPS